MDGIDENLHKWLDLTEQQYEIILVINEILQNDGYPAPKKIVSEYERSFGKKIQPSNMFSILKTLQKLDYVKKEKGGGYFIDFENIKNSLKQTEEKLKDQVREFKDVYTDLDHRLSSSMKKSEVPTVKYLDYIEYFEHLTPKIKDSTHYFITSKFPNICYTYGPYAKIGRGPYIEKLKEKTFKTGELTSIYLTSLDPQYPFSHSMALYGDVDKALGESEVIFDNLVELIDSFDNFDVFYLDNPYGLDVIIPEGKVLEHSYFFIRDQNLDVKGGIYIRNEEIAQKSKITFQNLCDTGISLKTSGGKRIIKKKRKELHDRFGKS